MFGEARAHHAYLFLNRRANRLKVFVHDGFGLWLCARRLQQGHFMRPSMHRGERFELSTSQLQALAVGLPWERFIARQSTWQVRVKQDGRGSRGSWIMPLMIVAGKRYVKS
jgi:hypothetical protein